LTNVLTKKANNTEKYTQLNTPKQLDTINTKLTLIWSYSYDSWLGHGWPLRDNKSGKLSSRDSG